MGRLILLRHGKAEPDSTTGEDFDRHLTPRGERESAAQGHVLADLGLVPNLALVSSAARARGTWEAASTYFPQVEVRFEETLYHADSPSIRRHAERALETNECVMIVGHNPGLQELTLQFLHQQDAAKALNSRAQTNFPTATAAVVEIHPGGRIESVRILFPER